MKKRFIVFDFDGTLCDVEHRRHHIADGNRNWKQFFAECVNDTPRQPVIDVMLDMVQLGHRVEIWSGRSDEVRTESEAWLDKFIPENVGRAFGGGSTLLRFMRPEKDYRSDVELKRQWLNKVRREEGIQPDMIYDDRQCVVDMWREEGIVCAQVAPGDFDKPKKPAAPRKPNLVLMIGPSGAGKSTILKSHDDVDPRSIVSSDEIRHAQFGVDENTQRIHGDAYTPAGFKATFAAVHSITKARLESGLDVVVDATNLRRKDRVALLENVGADTGDYNVVYNIVDRPLLDKLESLDPNAPHTNEAIVRKHHETFQSSKRDAFKGDGFAFVRVHEWSF